jgi:hypothetical protein
MPAFRMLCAAGELRLDDSVLGQGKVRWIERRGTSVAFSSTNGDASDVRYLGADMEIWIEREMDVPTSRLCVAPWPVARVHR